jgi:hypothetical protein
MAVVTTRETVTPTQAQAYLDTLILGIEHGITPRKEKSAHTKTISRDMVADEFEDTGESIKFHEAGFLVDGQHRLRAQVAARVTREWLICRGLTTAAVKVLDAGCRRSVKDMFTMESVPNAHRVTATFRKMYFLAAGNFTVQLSHKEYEHMLKAHPGILDSVRIAGRIPSFIGPCTNFAAVHYISANFQGEHALADEYLQMMAHGKLVDGSLPYAGDAATAIRERCLKERTKASKWTQTYWIKLAAHGWNLYKEQREVKNVKVPEEVSMKGWTVEACLGTKVSAFAKKRK